jgi:hypothetical protein
VAYDPEEVMSSLAGRRVGFGFSIGGSEILRSFFEEAVWMEAAEVHALAPYADDGAFTYPVVSTAWTRLIRSAKVTVVVKTPASANAVLKASVGRASVVDVRLNPRLHAKVFVAWNRAGRGVALLGSHNLTAAALRTNTEAGVLLKAGFDGEFGELFSRLRRFTRGVIDESIHIESSDDCRRSTRPPDALGETWTGAY